MNVEEDPSQLSAIARYSTSFLTFYVPHGLIYIQAYYFDLFFFTIIFIYASVVTVQSFPLFLLNYVKYDIPLDSKWYWYT